MDPSKLRLLSHAMDAYALRLQALSSNIANLDTPGYRRLSVTFEDALQEARRGLRNEAAAEAVQGRLEVGTTPALLEDELMELADTQMRTQLSSRALRSHFQLMRTAITGRAG